MKVLISKRIRLGAFVVGLGLAAGGIAYASIPDPNTGVIHGCYKTNKGDLRVIDPSAGETCTATETSLAWPAGPNDAYTTLGSASAPRDSTSVTVASLSLPVGRFAGVAYLQPFFHATVPILGDLTVRSGPAIVDLRCRASGNDVSIDSILIATQVGRSTSSSEPAPQDKESATVGRAQAQSSPAQRWRMRAVVDG